MQHLTLFSAGCGRLFEGSAAQLHHSLQKLTQLPDDTAVYCTHEYTLANLRFAMTIEPDNRALHDYQQNCQNLRQANLPTLPSSIATEKDINPFLRCQNNALQQRFQQDNALNLFSMLRTMKDQFKS